MIANNFLCFGNTELNLEGMGYTIVMGRNNRVIDNAVSNGSGKSTIFNAICFALTGTTASGLSNNLENIYGDPENCWVELHFDIDEDSFIIRRIKTPSADMKIYLNGIDVSGKGIRESNKILSDYIPDLTFQLIGSIIILGQGLPFRFTNNTPSHRKEILEKLTKSDFMIQSIRDKLDLRQIEIKSQLQEKNDSLIQVNTQLKMCNNQLAKYQGELSEYEKYTSSENSIDDQIKYIKTEINRLLGKIGSFGVEKTQAENNLEILNNKKALLLNKESSDEFELREKYNSEFNNLNLQKGKLVAESKSLLKEIEKISTLGDVCPTCGQKIVYKLDPILQKENLKDINEKLSEVERLIDELNLEKK